MHSQGQEQLPYSTNLLEVLNSAVLVLNEQLQLEYLNPAAEAMFEISSRRLDGTHWPEIVQTNPDWQQRLRQSLSAQHPFTQYALELQSAQNRRLTVDCAVTPINAKQLMLEMTQVDHRLRNSRDAQVLGQQQATRELLRGLAHEIKNPLGGLRGAAQLLQRQLPNPELDEYIQVIIGEADRLHNLVNRMLGPNNVPTMQAINIHRVLEHVCSLVEAENHQQLVIERQYDPSIPEIMADSELLVQTILNIVQNAVQAGAESVVLRSRIKRQFTIGHDLHKLVLMVDIIDNGEGISTEMQDKMFFPMVTGRADGTGLGLSIAQSIINQHHGIIECSSQPGRTCFRVLLPLGGCG